MDSCIYIYIDIYPITHTSYLRLTENFIFFMKLKFSILFLNYFSYEFSVDTPDDKQKKYGT